MKVLNFLLFSLLLNCNYLIAQKTLVLIRPSINLDKNIKEKRELFFEKLEKQAKKEKYVFCNFNNDDLNLEKNIINNLKNESLEIVCFEHIPKGVCSFSNKLAKEKLISKFGIKIEIKAIYILDFCENFYDLNFSGVNRVYNFYSNNLIIQTLTGNKIFNSIEGIDRRKIINVKVSSANSNIIFKNIAYLLLNLSDYLSLNEELDVIYKDQHIELPINKRDTFKIYSFDASSDNNSI